MYLKIDKNGEILRTSILDYGDGAILFDFNEDVFKRPSKYRVENNVLTVREDYVETTFQNPEIPE